MTERLAEPLVPMQRVCLEAVRASVTPMTVQLTRTAVLAGKSCPEHFKHLITVEKDSTIRRSLRSLAKKGLLRRVEIAHAGRVNVEAYEAAGAGDSGAGSVGAV